jgi:hypothetical protein
MPKKGHRQCLNNACPLTQTPPCEDEAADGGRFHPYDDRSRDAARIKVQDGRKLMDEIERLELRIEELREAIERSRRLRLAGRASAVIGPALLAGFALGLVAYTPTRMIVAVALAIGGVVLTGSSRSSTEELERSLKQAEAERMAAIDALDLVQVGGDELKSSLRGTIGRS